VNRAERDDLVKRIREADEALGQVGLGVAENVRRRELLQSLLGEYADRLPRAVLSIDPFTDRVYKRSFDPFGLDGPAWDARTMVPFDDPDPGPNFQVLLGAYDLRGRAPAEVNEEVWPGPPIPFVVPALLALPGMVAVIGRLTMENGDIGYPIAYFSDQTVSKRDLHQEWGRLDYWFKDPGAVDASWLASNYEWDFELAPWIERGKVLWIEPNVDDPSGALTLKRAGDGACPYVGLAGERSQQLVSGGELELVELPTGEPFTPFDE
jgi:hypothetical protein